MGPLLLVGLLVSGGSALYFWKKANPGKSLNPAPLTGTPRPVGTGTVVQAKKFAGADITIYSDGSAFVSDPAKGLQFFALTTKPPQLARMVSGNEADATSLLRSIG